MKTNFYSTPAKQRRTKMLKDSVPIRNARGKIIKHAEFQDTTTKTGKINADRKWFSVSRLAKHETVRELSAYEVYVNKGALPFSLTHVENKKNRKVDFQRVFGKSARRKKVNLEGMVSGDIKNLENKKLANIIYEETGLKETNKHAVENEMQTENNKIQSVKNNLQAENNKQTVENIFLEKLNNSYFIKKLKGQSKRIWNELYKVIDCSDVVIHVLDARDPIATKCNQIEKYVKNTSKKLVYLLNKVDLVPTSVTAKWLRILSKDAIAIAYHSVSLNNNYGKENLMTLLRQLSSLKGRIGVGFVGYPNVGKSSVINTLRNKLVCGVAPVPGETKVYKFIKFDKKINLIDCPGIVPPADYRDCVLSGGYRIENVEDPVDVFDYLFIRHEKVIRKIYGVDDTNFLDAWCLKFGRISKGGVSDYESAAKIILHDWIKGKIPYFVEPVEDTI